MSVSAETAPATAVRGKKIVDVGGILLTILTIICAAMRATTSSTAAPAGTASSSTTAQPAE